MYSIVYNLLFFQFFIYFIMSHICSKLKKYSPFKLLFRSILLYQKSLVFFYKVLTYDKKIKVIDNKHYLVTLYNVINNKWNKYFNLSKLFLKQKNSYFFWHFFNQDYLIQLFINLFMKDGKKSISYKNVYLSLFFFKKNLGVNPIFFFKKILYKSRLLFDITTLTLRKKIIIKPKLLTVKSQLTKSLKYLFNNYSLKTWKVKKKTLSFYKKMSYLLLNNMFNKDRLSSLIKEDTLTIKHNFQSIKKENFFSKYVVQFVDVLKKPFFKIKYKSITKKMKVIKSRLSLMKKIKTTLDFKKLLVLDRYNISLMSKKKIKTKWK